MRQDRFSVTGMSCSACSARVKHCVSRLPGVTEVEVNLLLGNMVVSYDEGHCREEDIIFAVKAAGYGITPVDKEERSLSTRRESTPILRRFLLSLVFLLPMMVLHHRQHTPWSDAMQAACLIPILLLNRHFFISGAKALIKGAPNMDTLIALGAGAGILYSVADILLLHDGILYLESAGMILTLISFGKWLEARATGKTGDALEKLRELMPDEAFILREGEPHCIPAGEIREGDTLLIRPGDKVPADACVVRGNSTIDESAFTGESMPVVKEAGSRIYAGTLNGNGTLEARVLRTRDQSALSDIITMVSEAATAKAPIARIADRISGIFVPLVVLISCITAALWLVFGYDAAFALGNAIAVLVISCPCALGLATPVAIMVGAGKGARHGILFRSGEVLEKACSAGAVILDKTGTITTGKPIVTDIIPISGTKDELLTTAAALEVGTNHPLGGAIMQAASGCNGKKRATDITYLPGAGICGRLEGEPCCIGNAGLIRRSGIDSDGRIGQILAPQGKTVVYVTRGQELLGCIAIEDPIRPDSADSVNQLRRCGLRVIMMTGDHPETARRIAGQAGIDEVFAEVLPADKASMVSTLQQQGYCVAMVGDGINDAPALTRADVGIAIGSGTDVAIESADIILIRSRLSNVVAAMQLSRAVIRNIRQNLFWAFFYNALTIPLAAGCLYPLFGWSLNPGIAAAAMSLSSFCVVCNALRLNRVSLFNPPSSHIMNTSITIRVTGMMCPHCERHMTEALLALPGVISCRADHKSSRVALELSGSPDEEILRSVVSKAGYTYGGIES